MQSINVGLVDPSIAVDSVARTLSGAVDDTDLVVLGDVVSMSSMLISSRSTGRQINKSVKSRKKLTRAGTGSLGRPGPEEGAPSRCAAWLRCVRKTDDSDLYVRSKSEDFTARDGGKREKEKAE